MPSRINYFFCAFFILHLLQHARSDYSSLSSDSTEHSSEGPPPSPNWQSPSLIEVSADGSDENPNSQASQFKKANGVYSPAELKHERNVEEEDEISDISRAILGDPQIEAPPTRRGSGGSSSEKPEGEVPQESQEATAYTYNTIKNLWLNSVDPDCGWFHLGLQSNCFIDYGIIGPVKFLDHLLDFVETLF